MMASGDSSQQLQPQNHLSASNNPQNSSNNPQSAALLQQCLGFGAHPQYSHNPNGNLSADQAAQFFHFLPPTGPNSVPQPPHLLSDFSQHNPYYYPTQNGDLGSRPTAAVSPLDLKYPNNSDLIGEPQTANSTNGSPFEFNPNGANMNPNSFYNHFDNYLSAMGDSYPSTSFMGMPPYGSANPYYHYSNSAATHNGSSTTNCMDLMQSQANVAANAASMLNQWKYNNSEKLGKSSSHGIKSFGKLSLSDRIPNPPHKIGPGTNNVRVRTQDKYRTVYTDRQRLELEKEFRSHQFVTTERKAVLAGELHLTERQVKIWFQNRRAKSRKQEPTHKSLRFVGALRH